MKSLPNVSTKFGAPMGRHAIGTRPYATGMKFNLQKVRMSACGAYDSGGAYWGIGPTLYSAESADKIVTRYIRAQTRGTAKQQIKQEFPSATFYR